MNNKKYFGDSKHENLAELTIKELTENWHLFLEFMHLIDAEFKTDLFDIFIDTNEVSLCMNFNKQKDCIIFKSTLTIDLGADLKPRKEQLDRFIKEQFESVSMKLPYHEIQLEFRGKYQDKTKFVVSVSPDGVMS